MLLKKSRKMRLLGAATLALCALFGACQREERRFNEPPSASRLDPDPVRARELDRAELVRYSHDAWAMSEGARLFAQMNCDGCHSHGGGGGMGPPLMDSKWIYGSSLEDIEQSILGGRPRGMPAYSTRLSPQQAWQLVAYVRSLSGHAPRSAEPTRDDNLSVRPPPSRTKPEPPTVQRVD
ncbi:MAG TPA: c-type cytochrome [Polyangiaceae bacterium]|jgi:cytochrome c oxidase cbb3-type subunit 3|nr:c-type cytochrome [Polyangiaceae bacterium]